MLKLLDDMKIILEWEVSMFELGSIPFVSYCPCVGPVFDDLCLALPLMGVLNAPLTISLSF